MIVVKKAKGNLLSFQKIMKTLRKHSMFDHHDQKGRKNTTIVSEQLSQKTVVSPKCLGRLRLSLKHDKDMSSNQNLHAKTQILTRFGIMGTCCRAPGIVVRTIKIAFYRILLFWDKL